MEIQVSNLGPFGGSFALPTETQGGEDCLRKYMKTPVRISSWPGLSPILKPRGPQLGQVGPKLGRSWAEVGPKLGPWPKLTSSGGHVADMSGRNGESGRCCTDLQNVSSCANYSPTTFWRPAWFENALPPPAEAVPVNRGLLESIGSAPKLSHLAPSVRADFRGV